MFWPTLLEYGLIEQDIVSVQVMYHSKSWLPERDAITFELVDLILSVEGIDDWVDNADMDEFNT